MNTISTIIVEDDKHSSACLAKLLTAHFPEIQVQAIANTVKSAIAAIKTHSPQLVFLDIHMPDGTSFDIIRPLRNTSFDIIITSSHNQYASEAFDHSAIHYLTKPVCKETLERALLKYREHLAQGMLADNDNTSAVLVETRMEKFALASYDGLQIIDLKNIIRCEAQESYTIFHLYDQTKFLMSKSLGNFERLLMDHHFFRIHDKHLVNIRYIKKYMRGKGGHVVMTDGTLLDVSVRRKDGFIQMLGKLVINAH